MRSSFMKTISRTRVLLSLGLSLAAGSSSAAPVDVSLVASRTTRTLAGASVPMWVFDCDSLAASNTACVPTPAGPRIEAVEGDTLTVHLRNTLPTPVTVVIPGQSEGGAGLPVMDGARVRSLVPETGPWVFTNLRAGTYLLHSGTHASIQVPMGLHGALIVRPAGGDCSAGVPAYPSATGVPGLESCHDASAVLVFSEVDAVLNAAVDALASGGAIDPQAYPSTVSYNPTFFLVNGAPHDRLAPPPPVAVGAPGQRVLLRLLNAGLRSHAPTILGVDLELVAEDGHLLPDRRREAATHLAAGKTLDVRITSPADATLPLYDRMLDLTNDNQPEGGMLAYLQVGTGSPSAPGPPAPAAPVAVDTDEDTPVTFTVNGSAPTIVGAPAHGTAVVNGDSTVTYTPDRDFFGTDTLQYVAEAGPAPVGPSAPVTAADLTSPGTVTITVRPVNDPPVARDDRYRNTFGTAVVTDAPGVLANDTDVDGDVLTATAASGSGLTIAPDGGFTYAGPSGSVTYTLRDGHGGESTAAIAFEMLAPSGLTLDVRDEAGSPVADYRWVVEEDATWQADPSVVPPPAETLATNFHRSHMPVVAQGCTGQGCAEPVSFADLALDPAKPHYVSVLPSDAGSGAGHTLGGARIPPAASGTVAVTVNRQPLPPAQISVYVFEDNSPTNGAVDGNESGLGGFQIMLEDAGGRYGMSGGPMSQDKDGAPLRNWLDCFGGSAPPAGVILSCPDTPANRAAGLVGEALIKNLVPGKYGVVTIPPTGAPVRWIQTSTIEGTKVIDAWVKAGEPAVFQEFGPPGWHVFVGFVSPDRMAARAGAYAVKGKVTNLHMSRPPDQRLFDSGSNAALQHTTAWVGLNAAGGIGENVAAIEAGPDGSFTIDNVPPGNYQLVVWDEFLDQIISFRAVTVTNAAVDLGNVPVFQWFARLEHNVFLDRNGDGVRDETTEPGIAEQNVNLRFRDGSLYQSAPTDMEGFVPFDETFPFFHWLVAEVDFARFKPTGVTVQVDGGGDVAATGGVLNPQVQADGTRSRTETGPVLTQGFQGFLGQTSVIDWGKTPYTPGENGGISGIVYYASTRAESDPRLGVGDPWEPGVPGVTVRLYREITSAAGTKTQVLVDEVQTDSWDASPPAGCPGADATDPVDPKDKCYDGLRNFNQVRPGVFDGGYAFTEDPAEPGKPLKPGRYVVEVVPPPGYELVKEEDVNVGFGDGFGPVAQMLPGGAMAAILPDAAMVASALAPEPGLAQPRCVGATRTVPGTLSLFPLEAVEAPFAGASRPLCDRKEVLLSDQGQAAADFFLFTSTPIAGHFTGMILNDLAQEFDPASPQFGEKWAPPFVPVSVRDYQGREISRTYSDQWGRINGLVPSTFTANAPSPSGYSPAMLTTCMNDPGPIAGPDGRPIVDPQFNPMFTNFCYTFQYMPGTTTYLDTPVLPGAAFASGYNPPDCALPGGTPVVRQVDGSGVGPLVAPGGTLVIRSLGTQVEVPNPAYEGPEAPAGIAAQKTLTRDYGFGPPATASSVTVGGRPLAIVSWSPDEVVATVPADATSGQLVVTRGDNGRFTVHSATVTVSTETPLRVGPSRAYTRIQDAIDAAPLGGLVLVDPGTYDELVILWKPVRLQGAGAGATFLNAVKRPAEKLVAWRAKMDCLFGIGAGCTRRVDPLPGQAVGAAGMTAEEGAAITVIGPQDPSTGQPPPGSFRRGAARIDGFAITGGDIGGGVFVNAWAHGLEISNNRVFGNSGSNHGGIGVGMPFLEFTAAAPFRFNRNVAIHHNAITQNGGLGGAGGGLALCTGTDNYSVTRNFVCGNFTTGDGGGIAHFGLSDNGVVAYNTILLNEAMAQGTTRSGGGLLIAGEPPPAGGLTLGSGSVTVDGNLIQGNHAGGGHGGGVRTQFVSGSDVTANPTQPGRWNVVTLTNNMIVNNVAGWSGGGVSLQDTARSFVVNNTIAHNDSTATVSAAFTTGDPNLSADQPAGLSSELHSAALNAAIPVRNNTNAYRNFSNPTLGNNILWRNRAFHYDARSGSALLVPTLSQASPGACPTGANYLDLGVLGSATYRLNPVFSVLTSRAGYATSNSQTNPQLAAPYCNGGRSLTSFPGTMQALPALDEGGALWIDVRYGPLDLRGDYHLRTTSPAINSGTTANAPNHDFDSQARPLGAGIDRGADEVR